MVQYSAGAQVDRIASIFMSVRYKTEIRDCLEF